MLENSSRAMKMVGSLGGSSASALGRLLST